MSAHEEVKPITPGQKWEVDLFRPEDAPGVARLFRLVYGESYPVKSFTTPKLLIEENAARRVISSVARTTGGDIVAHTALFCSAPFKGLYEAGAGLVDPGYRGGAIAFRLVEYSSVVVPRELGIETVFGEPVCNHIVMQKISERLGFKTCALEVDLMPASAYTQENSASGRVSTLLDFLAFTPKSQQTIYVPEVYKDAFSFVYEGWNQSSRFESSFGEPPVGRKSRIETSYFDFAQVARFAVHEAGEDFDGVFELEEKAASEKGAVIHQAWLKLSWPWVGRVVESLRARGYFFGGVLPRWFDEDGFLMQKALAAPNWEEIKLFSERAAKILDVVRADWANLRP